MDCQRSRGAPFHDTSTSSAHDVVVPQYFARIRQFLLGPKGLVSGHGAFPLLAVASADARRRAGMSTTAATHSNGTQVQVAARSNCKNEDCRRGNRCGVAQDSRSSRPCDYEGGNDAGPGTLAGIVDSFCCVFIIFIGLCTLLRTRQQCERVDGVKGELSVELERIPLFRKNWPLSRE